MNPIRLTDHARRRMREMRVDVTDVIGFISNAEITYTGEHYAGVERTVHQCGEYAVVTEPGSPADLVITVLYRDREDPDRRWNRAEELERRVGAR